MIHLSLLHPERGLVHEVLALFTAILYMPILLRFSWRIERAVFVRSARDEGHVTARSLRVACGFLGMG